jgi:hypothetical protein
MTEADGSKSERLLRREQAAKYVVETYNLPCSPQDASKAGMRVFGRAALPTRRALPPLSRLGARRLGTAEDRTIGQIDV